MASALNDLASAALILSAFPPQVLADATPGPAVDLGPGDGPCFAVQTVGAVSADAQLYGLLEQSDDGAAWAAVPGAAFAPAVAAGGVQTVRFRRSQRYVRWTGSVDGPEGSAVAAAVVVVQQRKTF